MVTVRVSRTAEIQAIRAKLPAVLTEQEIVDAVLNNDFSIVCGDTGCGKSTQVPQFLYEAGFTAGKNAGYMIGVTQPRRVAAVAVAERVGVELNDPKLVGYQVRYDKRNISSAIKFMTDGILLRELQSDIRLSRYSVIVVDEAHERSINCDLVLGLLSGSVRARKNTTVPLRVVIMSATLRMTDFTKNKIFQNPAVVQIDNRMHAVVVHYERTTPSDYVAEAVSKVQLIHKTLPAGSILVFVTGKAEVAEVMDALAGDSHPGVYEEYEENEDDFETMESRVVSCEFKKPKISQENIFNLGIQNNTVEVLHDEETVSKSCASFLGGGPGSSLRVFPLYAQLHSECQRTAFSAAGDFTSDRIVIVATNVAETSLTLPNIRYVIDCGREKRKEFNAAGVGRFAVRFCSQAAALQRAGRAGRVGPGHVYRLFSPNVFGEHMAVYSEAEIETHPLDQPVLFLASLGVPSFMQFPWPAPPPRDHVDAALKRLRAIGGLCETGVTPVGNLLVQFPIAPRLGAVLVAGSKRKDPELLAALLALVAMLSVESLANTMEARKMREIEATSFDDDMQMCVEKFVQAISNPKDTLILGLNEKALGEAHSLFQQLVGKAQTVFGLEDEFGREALFFLKKRKNSKFWNAVRECCLHGFLDQVALRDEAGSNGYRAGDCSELVYIHSSSVLHKRRPKWLAFTEMMQAPDESNKRTMRMCFGVDPEYLATIDSVLIDKTKAHPLLKPTLVGTRKIGWVVPKYTPLSAVLCNATKIDMYY